MRSNPIGAAAIAISSLLAGIDFSSATPHQVEMTLRKARRSIRTRGFTPIPGKRSRSTRGQHHPSYFTKRHTPARLRSMREDQEARLHG